MKHYGDVTKIDGFELPIVDCIAGGSPCQDLSVAGKREGMSKTCPLCGYKVIGNDEETVCPICGAELQYTRSGLFMELIRIAKEIRAHDRATGRAVESIRPRYFILENVPGLLSSNDGKDFQAVLTEIAKIAQPDAPDVPMPNGKWPHSGVIYGVGRNGIPFSIAWTLHDAQWWGVPQRRRRACVLADFDGLTAGDILFDPQLRRETEDSDTDQVEPNP